jgi:hypothetical protein
MSDDAADGQPKDAEPADNRLATITAKINSHYRNYKKHAFDSARYAIETGKYLLEAQQIVGRGAWGDFVRQQMPFSERTAQNYMRIAGADFSPNLVAKIGQKGAADLLTKRYYQNHLDRVDPTWRKEAQRAKGRYSRNGTRKSKRKTTTFKETQNTRQKWRDIRRGWGLIEVPWRRPMLGEVLRLIWRGNDEYDRVGYIWRERSCTYYGSSMEFHYVLLQYNMLTNIISGKQETNAPAEPVSWNSARDSAYYFGGKTARHVILRDPSIVQLAQHLCASARLGDAFFAQVLAQEKLKRGRQKACLGQGGQATMGRRQGAAK